MAKYTSKYKELTFFVGETVHRFSRGEFSTEDAKVIETLSRVKDVVLVEEAAPKKAAAKPEAKKTAPKKTAARKTSEK